MRRGGPIVIAMVGFGFVVTAIAAFGQTTIDNVPGSRQASVHQPWSPNYLPLLPNQPIQYGSNSSGSTNSHYHHGHSGTSFYFGGGYPAWNYGYGYGWGGPGYGGYPYGDFGYGYFPSYYNGPIILPPVVLPAESMYGPQAMKRFIGADQAPGNTEVIIANKVEVDRKPPNKPAVRVTNVAAKERAGKFIAFGDTQFAKQNYNQALERYKLATQAAPDLADCFMRQGFALVAMGHYESAARAMRRGLQIQADWKNSAFQLDQLYGNDGIAKTAHLEALAQAVQDIPQSADLLLLLGLQLFFNGELDRAQPVFERSAQLGGNDDGSIKAFLPKAKANAVPGGKEI
jgi:hypothetical protein